MKICPNCHRKNADSAKFCRYCGTKILNVKPAGTNSESLSQIKCPNCGRLNPKGSKFCRYCGASLRDKSLNTNESSNKSTSNKKASYRICPNCGTKNPLNTKYCVYCGYDFINKKMPERNTQSNNNNQQWAQAQQSLDTFKNYSSNYFQWFMDTLRNPLKNHEGSPYFGTVSFGLIALFIWIANRVGKDSSNITDQFIRLFEGFSPLKFVNENINNPSSVQLLIMSIVSVFLYVAITYFGMNFVSSHSHNLFSSCNYFAKLINVNVIASLLLIVSSVIGIASFAWVFNEVIIATFYVGMAIAIVFVRSSKIKVMNSIYVAIAAIALYNLIQPLLAGIIGTL